MIKTLSADFALALQQRRQRLAQLITLPVLLWSGSAPVRNFPANRYPFRASSHFLYFCGLPLEKAVIYLALGRLVLFWDEPTPDSALWHGEMPNREQIAMMIAAAAAYPLDELGTQVKPDEMATIALSDLSTHQEQCRILGREIAAADQSVRSDRQLAEAIVQLRLSHDPLALDQIRAAISVSINAHHTGRLATFKTRSEAEVRGAIEAEIIAQQMSCAYMSIVTTQGEVLHQAQSTNPLNPGDLLLVDVGAETPLGWAADITRTWPVSGRFSSTQRDIYEIVLAAHDACIAAIKPTIEYRDIHLLAAKILTEGLVDLGILRGDPETLVAMDAHTLFFPHGVGHLLGLDVHDMEDLGDLAGYAPGRQRSDRFGLCYLRLDRPLAQNMIVTIEPGFYQIPALLNQAAIREKYHEMINWSRLAQFSDVAGIRIEDDILVTDSGAEILTQSLPTVPSVIEA